MYVGYGALSLHLPYARDLKSKRRVLRGLIDRIHTRHRISVAETGHHELWQRAELGIAAVAAEIEMLEKVLDAVLEIVEREPEAEVLSWEPTVVREDT